MRRPADARLLELASGLLVLVWDSEVEPGRLRPQLVADSSAVPVVIRRQARLGLPLTTGGFRVFLLFRPEPGDVASLSASAIDADGNIVAAAPPRRGRADGRALTAGVTPEGISRLLRFMIGFGATLFGAARDQEWLALLQEVLEERQDARSTAILRCRLVDDVHLIEGRSLPPMPAGTDLVLLDQVGLHRVTILDRTDRDGVTAMAITLPASASPAEAILALPEAASVRLLTLDRARGRDCYLHDWLAMAGAGRPAARRRAVELLGKLASHRPNTAKLLLELRATGDAATGAPPTSLAIDLVLPLRAGLVIAGRIDDRHALISHLLVDRGGEVRKVEIDPRHRWSVPGGTDRFLALVEQSPDLPMALPAWIDLVFRSGARQSLGELMGPPDRAAALASLDGLARAMVGRDAPAELLLALRDLPSGDAALAQLAIGPAVPSPSLTLLLPLDPDPAIVRCRLGLLAQEPGAARLEILHLADARTPVDAARSLLDGLHAVHGLSGTLVHARNEAGMSAGAALANAMAVGRAPFLVRIGEGILPEHRGWTAKLQRFLARRPGARAVGLPVIAADDTLIHAGGTLELGEHGRPRLALKDQGLPLTMCRTRMRRTEILPDGCLAVRRADLPLLTAGLDRFHTAEGAMFALSRAAAMLGQTWTLGHPAVVRVNPRAMLLPAAALLRQADLATALDLAIRPERATVAHPPWVVEPDERSRAA